MKITDESLWESSEEELEQAIKFGREKMKRWRQLRLDGEVETDVEWLHKYDSMMLSIDDREFNRIFDEMEDTFKRAEKILNEKNITLHLSGWKPIIVSETKIKVRKLK
jgi:hypothetical protein